MKLLTVQPTLGTEAKKTKVTVQILLQDASAAFTASSCPGLAVQLSLWLTRWLEKEQGTAAGHDCDPPFRFSCLL